MALALRLLAAAFVLVALLVPGREVEAATPAAWSPPVSAHADGGSCGETEEVAMVNCGSKLERSLHEPLAMTLLRLAGIELDRELCREVLTNIWADQACIGRGPNCGEMQATPPPSTPKLASSSTSVQLIWASLDLGSAREIGLLVAHERPLASRDLQPPVPPPRPQA